MKVRHMFRMGGPISAAVTVADLPGGPAIIAAADGIYAWRKADGSLLPGFPVFGGNFFASQPLVVDLYGTDARVIIAGCDDNHLYGFDATGRSLPGFPLPTGGDVYSSPAAADLDGNGNQEIVHGSDDGRVYTWRTDGAPLPGWPQQTGGFVSASPVLVDLDGDGRPEILTGSWDKNVYAWRADGALLPGWPRETGHFVWSTPQAADLDGDGYLEVIAAADQVYAWRADGSLLPGWPQPVGSYVVARPLVADLDGDGRNEVLVAADRIYAWDAGGRPLPGFPLDSGTYFWSSPILKPRKDRDGLAVIACGWDGRLYMIQPDGRFSAWHLTNAPIFATPTWAECGQEAELLVGAWDAKLYQVRLDGPGQPSGRPAAGPAIPGAGELKLVKEERASFVTFPGCADPQGTMCYQAQFETKWHPVPLVLHAGKLTGLIQPFPAGTTVSYWAGINGQRQPASGTYTYRVTADLCGRLQRKVQRWMQRL